MNLDKKRFTLIDALKKWSKTRKQYPEDFMKAADELADDIEKIKRINRPLKVKIKDFFSEYKLYITLFIILTSASLLLAP